MDNTAQEKIDYMDLDYSGKKLEYVTYDSCTFTNCNFSNGDLTNIEFIDCTFDNCNLSMANITDTGLKNVKFIRTKMIGLNFSTCSSFLFSVEFEKCLMDYANFYKMKIKKTRFLDCTIKEAIFTGADLTGSEFADCDLGRTVFNGTNLSGVDFRSSFNFSIDPELNNIKKAKFSMYNIIGLLDKYDIIIE